MSTIIQLGSTRDGLEPYKERAESHGMECILIETPEYLKLREELGRQKFAHSIGVEHPSSPDEVIAALKKENIHPLSIITGFERYNYCTYEVAKKLHILPYDKKYPFKPLTKIEEREILKKIKSSKVLQPQYFLMTKHDITTRDIAHMTYPLIVKPVDGAGGLGVFVVKNFAELTQTLEKMKTVKQYDGGDFSGIMLEEFIKGDEYSIQGFMREGKITILSFGKKFIFTEMSDTGGIREAGLMVVGGKYIDPEAYQFTQTCIKAFKYRNGAFHIDMKRTDHGDYFLEMGFRVSGFGITKLTEQISGYNWVEEAFASLLKIQSNVPRKEVKQMCVGQVRARLTSEVEKAQELAKTNKHITVDVIHGKPPEKFSDRLKSDIVRHAGTIGKITVEGNSVEEVEKLLLQCLTDRLALRIN